MVDKMDLNVITATTASLPKLCLICGDEASGINFNVLTCFSCKSFFRRNASREKEIKCPFYGCCPVGKNTRKFCPKCRLQKCLQMGMKKEWILTVEQKQMIKDKMITKSILRHFQQQVEEIEEGMDVTEVNQISQSLPEVIENRNQNYHQTISRPEKSYPDTKNVLLDDGIIFDKLNLATPNVLEDNKNSNKLEQQNQRLNLEFKTLDQSNNSGQFEPFGPFSMKQPDGNHSNYHHFHHLNDNIDQLLSFDNLGSFTDSPMLSVIDFHNNTHDYITNYLTTLNGHLEDLCQCDHSRSNKNRELILQEKYLLADLSNACSSLMNPYKRILNFSDIYHANSDVRYQPYLINRLYRMSKLLTPVRQLPEADQAKLLKCSLVEMIMIQSVLMYNPDRKTWGLIDDKFKSIVMVPEEIMRPYISEEGFQRLIKIPHLFYDEWKQDKVIFDLLTVIMLFSPRQDYLEYDKIKTEHLCYISLLRRYLEMKYQTQTEAVQCYNKLMLNLEEIRQLSADVMTCLSKLSNVFTNLYT